jgi:1,4-alpha-glucan branching enzyme
MKMKTVRTRPEHTTKRGGTVWRGGIVLLAPLLACRAPGPEVEPRREVSVELELEASPAQVDAAAIVGELPGSPIPMRALGGGRFHARVSGLDPGRSYRYRFRARRRDLGRSVEVSDPRAWLLDASRERWSLLRAGGPPRRPRPLARIPSLRELVLYELNPREHEDPALPFAHPAREPGARGPGRLFAALGARIRSSEFDRLGVNALELLPVVASAWVRRPGRALERDPWGYSTISWYGLNGDYGSPEDLVALVDAAHARGLAVILDVSVDHGHGGRGHGLLTDLWPEWRSATPRNPWGLCELRIERADVQRFVLGALRRFLVDYGVDGFRMDWSESVPAAIWRPILAELRRIKPGVVLISENPVREHVSVGGFDGAWDFFFHWEAPLLLRGVRRNFDGVNRVQADTLEKLVENLTTWKAGPHAPPGPLVRYLESHDLPRIARPRVRFQIGGGHLLDVDGDGRTPDWLEGGGQESSRLGAVLLLTVPGAVMLQAGQEWGAADELVWAFDPLDRRRVERATLERYRRMIALRRRHPELRSDDLRVLLASSPEHLLAYSRGLDPARRDDDRFVVVLSFAHEPRRALRVPLPAAGRWRDQLSGAFHDAATGELRLDLAPLGAALLERESGPY